MGCFCLKDLQFSMCCQCWKWHRCMERIGWLWHESMVNLLLEIPPSPTINGAKLTLAPGCLAPKKDGLCLGWSHCRILLGHTLGGTQVEAGWCHVRGYESIHIKRRSRPLQGKGVSKRKSSPKCGKIIREVFSDRKKMVVFLVERQVGIGRFSSCSSLTPTREIAWPAAFWPEKKTAAESTKKWFPCEVFFLKAIVEWVKWEMKSATSN